ncbi:MAG: CxxC-x17-CxxC domain-containing protein [Candidatus Nanoarchaeia archaeon]
MGDFRGGGRGGGRDGGRDGGRGGFGGGFGGPKEMHKATCSGCGQECEVPFKPTEGRPVFCRDCFAKNRPPRN